MSNLTDKLIKLDEEQLANLYKRVFDSADAQLVLEDLKNRCFYKTSTAHDNSHQTYLHEGMRLAILHIETQINYKPQPKEKTDDEFIG